MTDKYILIDKKPVAEPDLIKWAQWFESADRHVAKENIGEVQVSTVFLGIDHSFHFVEEEPILFETMIFGGKHDGYQDRCSTWEEAEEMHKAAVELVEKESSL